MDDGSEPILIYSTFGELENAKKVARGLISLKLGACVNLIPKAMSFYEWEGVLEESEELIMLIKTVRRCEERVMEFVCEHHDYDVPALISLDIAGGAPDYLLWARGQVISE